MSRKFLLVGECYPVAAGDSDVGKLPSGQIETTNKIINLNNVGQLISEWFDITTSGTTAIQLSHTPMVVIDVIYNKTIHLREGSFYDWTISGDTITFSNSLDANDTILVIYKY